MLCSHGVHVVDQRAGDDASAARCRNETANAGDACNHRGSMDESHSARCVTQSTYLAANGESNVALKCARATTGGLLQALATMLLTMRRARTFPLEACSSIKQRHLIWMRSACKGLHQLHLEECSHAGSLAICITTHVVFTSVVSRTAVTAPSKSRRTACAHLELGGWRGCVHKPHMMHCTACCTC
jgi:hypothetical protein